MTVLAILLIALVTVGPLALPWLRTRGYLSTPSHDAIAAQHTATPTGTVDRIRFHVPPSPGMRIDRATHRHQAAAVNQDRLREGVIRLIERHPDRGAEIVRRWLHQ